MAPDKKNVVIIGGGIIGLCCAYYLNRNGASVTLLEKGEPGHGSSLHNAGYLSPSHFMPLAAPGVFSQAMKWMWDPTSPLYIKPRFDAEFISWAIKFARSCNEAKSKAAMPLLRDLLEESMKLYEAISVQEGMKFDLQKKGLLMLYNSPTGRDSAKHEADTAHEIGVEASMVNRFDLHELEPEIKFSATGAVYFPNDAHLAPAELVKDLAAYLERSGVRILKNISVTAIETSSGKITGVKTSGGEFTADEYVMAAGAWTSRLLRPIGIHLPLQAGKGYSITHSNPPVKPRIPAIFVERRCAVTPLTYSLRFAGTMEFSGMDLSLNQERIGAILDAIPRYYGNVAKPNPAKSLLWAGLRPVTPDGLPYIGRFDKYSNLIAATGHAMLGVSLGTITGKLVAEIAADKSPSHDITLLKPDRFG